MTWCFRIRVDLHSKLQCKDSEWIIDQPEPDRQIKLAAADAETIADAHCVTLRGSGYASEEEALAAGAKWRAQLMAAFTAIRVGADFGDRSGRRGAFTTHALASLAPQHRALNDVHGLIVFECEPSPVFLRIGPITATVTSPHGRLVAEMANAIENGGLSEERQVSYDLFAASFGQESADARFALLMMALESMIDLAPRSAPCREHVYRMIALTEESGLPSSEIRSIVGSMRWLLDESIGQAGRKLAKRLEPKRYNDKAPAAFFTTCYELRSRLIHGHHPLPTTQEIGRWIAPLAEFVADLLMETLCPMQVTLRL